MPALNSNSHPEAAARLRLCKAISKVREMTIGDISERCDWYCSHFTALRFSGCFARSAYAQEGFAVLVSVLTAIPKHSTLIRQ